MATGEFNPYHQWLGIDPALTQPNYYELLGIDEREADAEKISAAADIAMSRVRSFRPGERAAWWARLLDEIAAAKKCLHDPGQRAEYDRRLQDRGGFGGVVPRRPAPRSKHLPPETTGAEAQPGKVPMSAPQAVPMSAPGATPRPARGGSPPSAPPTPLPLSGPNLPAAGGAYPGGSVPVAEPPMGIPGAGTYPHAVSPYGSAPQYPPAPGYSLPPAVSTSLPPQPGTPYAYAPPVPQLPAYTPPMPGYGPAVPPAMPVPPGAAAAYPAPPARGYPGAAPVSVPMGIPVVADTNDPYSAALSSPQPSHEKRRPSPPVVIERSGVSKWLAMAIGAAVVFVVVGLGILLAVIMSNPHGKDGSDSPSAEAGKHQKTAGTSSTPRHGVEKKERSFKPTAEQQEAAKRGAIGGAAGSDGVRSAREPGPIRPGFPATNTAPDATSGIPGIDHAPGGVTSTTRPADLPVRGPPGGATESVATRPGGQLSPSGGVPGPTETGLKPGPPDAREPGPSPPVMPGEQPRPAAGPQPDKPPETAPEPGTPADPIKPTPAKPQPAGPPPTAAEVASLATALTAARSALLTGNFDAASKELGKAEPLPMLPEHRAKFERLQSLTQLAKNFRAAVSEALGSFRPAEVIAVGSSTEVSVVKSSAESITINVRGKNQTHAVDQLPTGLMLGIADSWLPKKNPNSLAQKAAFLATLKGASAEQTAQARQWFQEAASKGADCGDLAPVLDDKYDLGSAEK